MRWFDRLLLWILLIGIGTSIGIQLGEEKEAQKAEERQAIVIERLDIIDSSLAVISESITFAVAPVPMSSIDNGPSEELVSELAKTRTMLVESMKILQNSTQARGN